MVRWIVYAVREGDIFPVFTTGRRTVAKKMAALMRKVAARHELNDIVVVVRAHTAEGRDA